jgi:hypothetical protein
MTDQEKIEALERRVEDLALRLQLHLEADIHTPAKSGYWNPNDGSIFSLDYEAPKAKLPTINHTHNKY